MGIYILNISVDAADTHPQNIPEDLTYNDQESIVEIFVEKVLGFENALAEYDDHDTQDHNTKNLQKIDLMVHFSVEFRNTLPDFDSIRQRYIDFEVNLTKGFFLPDNHPPKFLFLQT